MQKRLGTGYTGFLTVAEEIRGQMWPKKGAGFGGTKLPVNLNEVLDLLAKDYYFVNKDLPPSSSYSTPSQCYYAVN